MEVFPHCVFLRKIKLTRIQYSIFADNIREVINVADLTSAGVVKLLVLGLEDICADKRLIKIF